MMIDISQLPHKLDREKHQCRAIIETPKGRHIKFKYEKDSGLFSISKILPQGFSFPFEFGFVPSTMSEDEDPMDIIVLIEEPTHVGCLLEVRLLGAVKVEQTSQAKTIMDHRLVGVPVQSFDFAEVWNWSDLPNYLTQQINEFLSLYNKNSGTHDKIIGTCGPEEAMGLIEEGIRRCKAQ